MPFRHCDIWRWVTMSYIAIFSKTEDAPLENRLNASNVFIRLSSSWMSCFCLPFVNIVYWGFINAEIVQLSGCTSHVWSQVVRRGPPVQVRGCFAHVNNATCPFPSPVYPFLALVWVNLVKFERCFLYLFYFEILVPLMLEVRASLLFT